MFLKLYIKESAFNIGHDHGSWLWLYKKKSVIMYTSHISIFYHNEQYNKGNVRSQSSTNEYMNAVVITFYIFYAS